MGFLAKIDDNGNIIWDRVFNYENFGLIWFNFYDLIQFNDSGYLVAGSADKYNPEINFWEYKGLLIKTDNYGCVIPGCHITSTQKSPSHSIDILLYPNPTSNILQIQLENVPNGTFKVFDATGSLIHKFSHFDFTDVHILDVSTFIPGTYHLQYTNKEGQIWAESFVVSR